MKTQHDQEWLDRLTKKARDEIVGLREKVDSLEARLSVGPEDSNAFLDPYRDASRPLGKDPVIQFRTGDPDDSLSGFTVQFKGAALLVQGMAPSHDDYMAVMPMSGNYVKITHVREGDR